MAVYAITGKLGTGKGKAAVQRMREYLKAGKRVATNCDLFLEHLLPESSKSTVQRIPDKPSISDFYALGSGNKFIQFEPIYKATETGYEFTAPAPKLLEGFDEAHNGALVLDECGSWLNTRNFQDKSRAHLLEWAIHARKYGWDIYFICQNIKQVDAQLRESLFEYVVRLSRLDRMKIPFVSAAIKAGSFGTLQGSLPRMHIGVVRLGASPDAMVADRWVFRGDDLNKAYNTTQVFSDSYPHAIHSLISSWHLSAKIGLPGDFVGAPAPDGREQELLKSRYEPPKQNRKHMKKFIMGSLLVGGCIGFIGAQGMGKTEAVSQVHTYATITATGYVKHGKDYTIILSDNRSMPALKFNHLSSGYEAMIEKDVWVKGQ